MEHINICGNQLEPKYLQSYVLKLKLVSLYKKWACVNQCWMQLPPKTCFIIHLKPFCFERNI